MPAVPATGPARPAGIDELLIPGATPANIRAPQRIKVEGVTNDLYNISGQLREINDRLFVNIMHDRLTGQTAYAVMEATPVGDQLVFKCTALDGRVLEHVRYLLSVPFEKRYAEAEKILARWEADEHEAEMDQLVERLGLPMVRDLQECGFLDQPRSSMPRPKNFGRGA